MAYAWEGYCGVYATWHFEDGILTISGTGTINAHPWSDSPESIGGWAFDGCNSLRQVTYNGMQSELSTMEISDGNAPLLNAPWQFGLKGTTDMLLQPQTVSSGIALLAQVVVEIICSVILYRQKKYPYL